MTDENTVRLEYLGSNNGAIPFKGVSGRVYRAAKRTYRFIDALEIDVTVLVGTGKFRVVQRENEAETVPVDHLQEIPAVMERETAQESAQEAPQDEDIGYLDISTIAALETALDASPSLEQLYATLELEQDQENPRKGIVKRLTNAIDNFSDTGNV